MQLFILNRTNERQTKSVGRILLYALLFFIVTRIAVMLMLTGCTAIYMANTGLNPMQGLSFFGNRYMQTLRKLPMHAPKMNTNT